MWCFSLKEIHTSWEVREKEKEDEKKKEAGVEAPMLHIWQAPNFLRFIILNLKLYIKSTYMNEAKQLRWFIWWKNELLEVVGLGLFVCGFVQARTTAKAGSLRQYYSGSLTLSRRFKISARLRSFKIVMRLIFESATEYVNFWQCILKSFSSTQQL
jgi:hypothetical protein